MPIGKDSIKTRVAKVSATEVAETPAAEVTAPAKKAAAPAAGSGNTVDINSPFPGTVTKILVSEGDEFEAGDVIAVVEAMKMENEIKPDKAGIVREICVDVKAVVTSGQALFKVEEK